MEFSIRHNLRGAPADAGSQRFGIRVVMPARDPLRAVLGNDWHKEHWFASREERDRALVDMGQRHAYSRIGDTPSIVLTSIER